MSMATDNEFNAEKVKCISCGGTFYRGTMYLSECYGCRNKEDGKEMKLPKIGKLKRVKVVAKEWFDKTYGNSYFSAQVTINDEHVIKIPFQYGYGNHYESAVLDLPYFGLNLNNGSLHRLCEAENIILDSMKIENCTQRKVKEWGK